MGWIESARYGKGELNIDSDPMPESHTYLIKIVGQDNIPFWKIIYENRTAWLQDPDTFMQPNLAPIHIIIL